MLYMNCPGIGKREQQAGTALDLPAFSEVEYSNQLAEVFREFGHRYGTRVAGYWFDSWFQTTESYPNLPHEALRSEEHTSELQSLMRISYAVFCLKKKTKQHTDGPVDR